MEELEVLLNQADELLTGGIEDEDDAIEFAVVAGLAHRLGVSTDALQDAEAWRDGMGAGLLDDAWRLVDLDTVIEAIDELTPDDDPDKIEETLFDFDDLMAAAIWSGKGPLLGDASKRIAALIRLVPDTFANISTTGIDMARTPGGPRPRTLRLLVRCH